ncbi:MAG: helix-turn-helix transcriptional regulator [Deltaproteobacteria bacterium]|nr:helix-turn-helix transcriptional regulator [Deltaproteobacteria bacterium]
MNYAGQRLGRGPARHHHGDPRVEHDPPESSDAGALIAEHVHAPASFGALSPAPLLERAADLFRALGDTARLSLLEKLTHGEFCVGELADSSGEALSTVSQRLRRLRGDALVRRRRDGKHIYYTVADEHVAELIRTALDHALHEHEPTAAGEDAGEEEDEG